MALKLLVGTVLIATLAGCAVNERSPLTGADTDGGSQLAGVYAGAGASSQEAAQATWIAAFQTEHPAVTINYNPIGSGGGRSQFIQGAVVYAGSDSPLLPAELAGATPGKCAPESEVLNLPVYVSPVAVIFSIPGVSALNLDAASMAQIFKGEITRWDDPQIAALNPGANLPKTNITVVFRSDDSGTTKNLGDYLHQNVPEIWDAAPSDKFPFSFPGAEGAQGSSGVVEAVRSGSGTIGYADASKTGEVASAALQVGDTFVEYSAAGAAALLDVSERVSDGAADLAINLDRKVASPGVYPLATVSYLITCRDYANPKDGEVVKAFASYAVSPAGQERAATGAGSAPLSEATRAALQNSIELIN